jgi:hypothetical protein
MSASLRARFSTVRALAPKSETRVMIEELDSCHCFNQFARKRCRGDPHRVEFMEEAEAHEDFRNMHNFARDHSGCNSGERRCHVY